MSECENLTKLKVKKSQEKYLNLAIQEFYDDIELDMNDVNTMFYACGETVKSKLGVNSKNKTIGKKRQKQKTKVEN